VSENHENQDTTVYPQPILPPGGTRDLRIVGETARDPANAGHPKRLVKRIVKFALSEPYEDFTVTAWINFDPRLLLKAVTEEERIAALQKVILEHDLVDFDGEPYPPSSDPEFIRQVPDDVLRFIMAGVEAQKGHLPTKPATR